jgi:Spy/CpxP family protein refolding chaperone
MKKNGLWLAILMALALVIPAGTSFAQEDTGIEGEKPARVKKEKGKKKNKADKPKREKGNKNKGEKRSKVQKSEWEQVWVVMAKEVELTADEQATLKQKVEAKQQALAEWEQANGAKLAELKKSYSEARKADEKDKAKEIRTEMGKLSAEQKKLAAEKNAECMAVLTAEQKDKWEGVQMFNKVVRRYRKVNLDDGQKTKMKGICIAGVKDIAAADAKAKKAAIKKVEQDCTAVLTAEQREQVSKPKADKPKRQKADKPKKEKKAKQARDNDADNDDADMEGEM